MKGLREMNDGITVYEKPTCTKCREADRLLRESGIDFEKVNYYIEPIGEEKLRELIGKMGISPRELLRTSEAVYKELGLGDRELSDDEIIRLMVEHPDLIQRPIVERGPRAVLGRPTEKIKELL
jgi:arsenate reductase